MPYSRFKDKHSQGINPRPTQDNRSPFKSTTYKSVLENRYIINDKIGFGGFGTVFDAVDARRNISIVVKVVCSHYFFHGQH